MYVTDLYTLTIRPNARGIEPLSIMFVGQLPWKQDVLKCLNSAKYELESRKEAAQKAEEDDECLASQLTDDIAQHELAIEIITADKVNNYKETQWLAPRAIQMAKVEIGRIIWSVDEVWQ
jgi:hypothetical protein